MRRYLVLLGAAGLAAVTLGSCGTQGPRVARSPAVALPVVESAKPSDYSGLHNVVAYAPDVMSGSVPEGQRGFDTLAGMGVRTVISVDGATPDVALARARGMRYIHLPIGYNGMGVDRTLELARAVKDAQALGPVYVHCHHGKHRSAGAAGAALVTLGRLTAEQAQDRMRVSGTSANYPGLYECVAIATVASPTDLAALDGDFPEVQKPTGMVECMVEVDEVYERLLVIEKAGWRVPRDHPDLVPAAEAGRLADLFRHAAAESPATGRKPAEFRRWLEQDAGAATAIEAALASGGAVDRARLSGLLGELGASCTRCHAAYRDKAGSW